jgi:DNA polymerase-3 subunit delta
MHLIVSKDKEEIRRALEGLLRESRVPITSFYPDNFTVDSFFQEVETQPFLTPKKSVVIHELDQLPEAGVESVRRYLEKPSRWISIYLTANELASQSKLAKLVEKNGKVLRFKDEKPWEKEKRLVGWLIAEAKRENVILSKLAALALVQGVDHQMLLQELNKLICFVGEGKEVTLDAIALLSTPIHNETFWQLGDAIFACETALALTIGSNLLEDGMAIFPLLAGLRSQLATGIEILHAAERGELSQKFAYLKGKLLEKKMQMLKAWNTERLQQGVLLIFETEVKAKNSSIVPAILLELLIVRLGSNIVNNLKCVGIKQ